MEMAFIGSCSPLIKHIGKAVSTILVVILWLRVKELFMGNFTDTIAFDAISYF